MGVDGDDEHTQATKTSVAALYLNACIGKEKVRFLLDTDSSISMLNLDMFDNTQKRSPDLFTLHKSELQFETVSGELVKYLVIAIINIEVGVHHFTHCGCLYTSVGNFGC